MLKRLLLIKAHPGWNYVDSNPVNRTDPSGLCWYPNLQTGGTSMDSLNPPPSGLCSWFIEIFEQNGWNIPTNATPNNWISYISENERARLLSAKLTPPRNIEHH